MLGFLAAILRACARVESESVRIDVIGWPVTAFFGDGPGSFPGND